MLDDRVYERAADMEQHQLNQAAEAHSCKRDYLVAYLGDDGQLRSFQHLGVPPSRPFEELEKRGVDFDRGEGRWAVSWVEGKTRHFKSSDEEMKSRLEQLTKELEKS